MSAWVVSLLGIVVITLVCDVILPQGQTTKYVKSVISVIVVCAIVFPLVSVVKSVRVDDLFEENSPAYQQNYLQYVKSQKQLSLQQSCDRLLRENGINGCKTVVNLDDDMVVIGAVVHLDRAYYNAVAVEKVSKVVRGVVNVENLEVKCVVKE